MIYAGIIRYSITHRIVNIWNSLSNSGSS